MIPKISYLVCSTRGSGASLLCEGLKETELCGYPSEYICPDHPKRIFDSQKNFLEKGTTPNGIFGAKIYWMHFESLVNKVWRVGSYKGRPVAEAIQGLFPNVRYVHVRRRDKIRQAISCYGEPKYDYFKINELRDAFVRNDARWLSYFRKFSIQPLEIFYEDIVNDHEKMLERVFDFLGLQAPQGVLLKKSSVDPASNEAAEDWYRKYKRTPAWLWKGYRAWKFFRDNPLEFQNRLRKKIGLSKKRKVLFVVNSYFYPESIGGSELSTLYLLKSLKKRGWIVSLMCMTDEKLRHSNELEKDGRLGFTRWPLNLPHDQFRAEVCRKIKEDKPHIILNYADRSCSESHVKFLNEAILEQRPILCFVRVLPQAADARLSVEVPHGVRWLANSPFTEGVLHALYPNLVCAGTVLPLIKRKRYLARKRNPRYITLINVAPEKGVDIALKVAQKLPDINFLFIKARWASCLVSQKEEGWLERAKALQNVTVWDVQEDMKTVYAVTNVLLMPSQSQETFGRVIIEAHLNGIPVVASRVGGIPFAMGNGGVLVDPKDDVDQYVAAIRSLKNDKELYRRLSDAALKNSRRPEFDPEYQVDQFIDMAEKAIQNK